MKAFTFAIIVITATTAALYPTGSSAANFTGFAKSCDDAKVVWNPREYGGSAMLQAICKLADGSGYAWSELDLNNCFGWDTYHCTYFLGANFTNYCHDFDWNGATSSLRCDCYSRAALNGGQTLNYTVLPMGELTTSFIPLKCSPKLRP